MSYLRTRCAGDEAALSEILSLLRASREEGPLDRLERRMGSRDSADREP